MPAFVANRVGVARDRGNKALFGVDAAAIYMADGNESFETAPC